MREDGAEDAIPPLPLSDIRSFLTRQRVLSKEDYESAPYVVAVEENRLIAGDQQLIYARRFGDDLAVGQHYVVARPKVVYSSVPDGWIWQKDKRRVKAEPWSVSDQWRHSITEWISSRGAEVLGAVALLQGQLADYRGAVEAFSGVLRNTALQSPVAGFDAQLQRFAAAATQAAASCDSAAGDDCAALNDAFAQAQTALQAISTQLAAAQYPSLVDGTDPAWSRLTLAEFQQFRTDAGQFGEGALPAGEVALLTLLLDTAGVALPGGASFAALLAQREAAGAAPAGEVALFDPLTGDIGLADLLLGSATTLSPSGNWLDIDMRQSPVVQGFAPEPGVAALSLVALWALACQRWRRGYITRPNHHTLRPPASTASKAPAAANNALISVSRVSTTRRLDRPW